MAVATISTLQRCAMIVAALLPACTDDEPITLADSSSLIGKCAFQGSLFGTIQPGDIFLYAAFDSANGTYAVVTGTAHRDESLLGREARQDLAPVYAAVPALNSLEFGTDKYIGTGNRSGEVHYTGGRTYGSDAVYPTCVFWPD